MRHLWIMGIIVSLCGVMSPLSALAQEEAPAEVPAEAPAPYAGHTWSVTFSPIHLVTPVLELMVERRLMDKLSVALIVGGGRDTVEVATFNGIEEESIFLLTGGAQARYYLLGDFRHGLQVGAELLYVYAGYDDPDIEVTAGGVSTGPFVGYKIAADFGLTFDAQLGFQYQFVGARDESSSATASESGFAPLLNLNVGWSF